jgi:hypothetical protein
VTPSQLRKRSTETARTAEGVCFATEVWFMDTKSTYPTVAEINALPDKARRYIRDLEMRINDKGQALTMMQLSKERDLLRQRVDELEAHIAVYERAEQLEPMETD